MISTSAAATAQRIAQHLADPPHPPPDEPWTAHSLAQGAAGTALLHIEQAHTGAGNWQGAHRWITTAASGEISAADNTGLFLGAPAVGFMLHAASTDTPSPAMPLPSAPWTRTSSAWLTDVAPLPPHGSRAARRSRQRSRACCGSACCGCRGPAGRRP